jgi:carboxypeptidase Taq
VPAPSGPLFPYDLRRVLVDSDGKSYGMAKPLGPLPGHSRHVRAPQPPAAPPPDCTPLHARTSTTARAPPPPDRGLSRLPPGGTMSPVPPGPGARPPSQEGCLLSGPFARLEALWAEIADLQYAAAVLEWDQLVHMPPGGAAARAEQLATLRRLAHERLASPELGEALAAAEAGDDPPSAATVLPGLDPGEVRRAWLRVARREHDRAVRVPSALVAELARAETDGYFAWVRAREEDRFEVFRPALARLLDLVRQYADALGHGGQRYDALVGLHEPGLRTERLQVLFAELRQALPPLVAAIRARPPVDRRALRRPVPEEVQRRIGEAAITAFGYDWTRGRQDRSVHPFSTSFGSGDCRITTRFAPDDLAVSLFATMHEAGHALYEQGIPAAWRRGPLGQAASTGVHESQSRLWENCIGRSRAFWEFFAPTLRRLAPEAFADVSAEALFRAANAVEPGLIRVEADEVTYNLHVALRFELELGLISGDLPLEELPAAWNDGMEAALGVRPRGDREGCLQDVHWSGGSFGYFPSYTLGTVLAAQWMEAAAAELGDLDALVRRGEFAPLLQWLRGRIHGRGAMDTPEELALRVSGRSVDPGPYLRYLREKYGELYGLA